MIDVVIGFAVGLFVGAILGILVLALLINNTDLPDFSELNDNRNETFRGASRDKN